MPKELIASPEAFHNAALRYLQTIKKEPFQPLSDLIAKIKLCSSNSTISLVAAS